MKIKNQKHGFTLVELIVVLTILVILASLLIPSLTGYIRKAKEKAIITEALYSFGFSVYMPHLPVHEAVQYG
mgnify:CR=1 FL=1